MIKIKLFCSSVFLFSLFCFATNTRSQTFDLKLSASGQQPYETLLSANQFEGRNIGYSGSTSKFVQFRRSDKWIRTQFGCMIMGSSVGDLIETENPAIMDLNRPKESLDDIFEMDYMVYTEWNNRKKRKKIDVPPKGHGIDILHGGYSVFFRDRTSF